MMEVFEFDDRDSQRWALMLYVPNTGDQVCQVANRPLLCCERRAVQCSVVTLSVFTVKRWLAKLRRVVCAVIVKGKWVGLVDINNVKI